MSKGFQLIGVAKVHGHGRVVIPQDVRVEMKVEDGEKIAFHRDFQGNIVISKIESSQKGPRFGR